MSWILKWLGIKALKALAMKVVVSTWTRPGMHKVSAAIQEYIDDPSTQDDEELVAAFERFSNHFIEKKLGKL